VHYAVAGFSRYQRILFTGLKQVRTYKLDVNEKMQLEDVKTKALLGSQA